MSVPVAVPCPWPVDPGCFEDGWDNLEDDVKTRAVALASATLRRLTAYRVGGCPIKVRPCRKACFSGSTLPAYVYYAWSGRYGMGMGSGAPPDGLWINSCGCTGDCHCSARRCAILLPRPASNVSEVKVNGSVVAPSDYALTDGHLSYVGAGDCPWPTCQDLSLPDTQAGTFSVTYLNSYPVDASGAYAAGVLANEFALACQGKTCQLPLGVRTVARQGVTYDIQPGAFPDGFTGIREVDTYISLWNPHAIRPPVVWSPDIGSRVSW